MKFPLLFASRFDRFVLSRKIALLKTPISCKKMGPKNTSNVSQHVGTGTAVVPGAEGEGGAAQPAKPPGEVAEAGEAMGTAAEKKSGEEGL